MSIMSFNWIFFFGFFIVSERKFIRHIVDVSRLVGANKVVGRIWYFDLSFIFDVCFGSDLAGKNNDIALITLTALIGIKFILKPYPSRELIIE